MLVPLVTLEGSNFFGLIVILLLARRIKALLQKRSSLKVVRVMTQEQKRSLFIDVKATNLQPKANIIDVFVYESKASKAAFFDIKFLLSKIFPNEQSGLFLNR